jgi:hypothetical protein
LNGTTVYEWENFGNYKILPCNFKDYDLMHWLTSSVMLAFFQNEKRIGSEFNATIEGGMKYLQFFVNQFDTCSASLATFVFTFYKQIYAESMVKNIFKREFLEKVVYIYDSENIASDSNVLVSSYVVWTLLKFERYEEAGKIVNWLDDVIKLDGILTDHYDITVALWALIEYAEKYSKTHTEFRVEIIDSETDKVLDEILIDADYNPKFIKEYQKSYNFRFKGYGKGILHINLEEYIKSKNVSTNLNLTVTTSLESQVGIINVCLKLFERFEYTHIEIHLPSEFKFNDDFNSEFQKVFGKQKFLKVSKNLT